jgi:hypothetical protein
MSADLLQQAADRLLDLRQGPMTVGMRLAVGNLLEVYARTERATSPEDGPVDDAIHALAEEVLR